MPRASDEIGVVVKEHSGWLIPLVVFFITACLSALVLAYYFAPRPGTIGRELPEPTESNRRIDLTIGAVKFHFPANYLPLESSRSASVLQAVELAAFLPDFRGYAANLAGVFESTASNSPAILFRLRAAELLPDQDRMRRIYQPQLQDEAGEDAPFGLKHYTFRASSGYRNQELFYAVAESGAVVLICDKADDSAPSPNCLRDIPIADGLALSYRFKRAHLKQWREIDKGTRALIASFRAKS